MSYRLINRSAHDTGLAAKSIDCVVTSPPYFALRKYAGEQAIEWPTVEYSPMPGLPPIRIQGCESECKHEWADGRIIKQSGGKNKSTLNGGPGYQNETHFTVTQGAYCIHCGGWRGGLGLEPTIEAYIGHLILVMREQWRVLRDDGTAWVNLGDSYSGSGGAHTHDHANPGLSNSDYRDGAERYKADGGRGLDKKVNGLRAKSMMGIPWRFAFAAQADGWILRSDIIWAKKNCMPESVTDRPTKAHEYIFLLAKSGRYFYDALAVAEPAQEWTGQAATFARTGPVSEHVIPGQTAAVHRPDRVDKQSGHGRRHAGFNERWDSKEQGATRNRRDVWTMPTCPYPGSHFATFPLELPETCIRASTSAYGICPACGAGWRRVVDKETHFEGGSGKAGRTAVEVNGNGKWAGQQHGENIKLGPVVTTTTTGWEPTCICCRVCDELGLNPEGRKVIHATQRPRASEDMAQGVGQETLEGKPELQGKDEADEAQIRQDLRQMRNGIHGEKSTIQILQSDLFGKMDVGERARESDKTRGQEPVRTFKGKRKNGASTSPGDGEAFGEDSFASGEHSSYQRRQERQQNRELDDHHADGSCQAAWQVHELIPYEPIPATVLDPFSGSGTTGRAALMLGRNYIGVDISQEYLENLAPDRLSNIQMEMPL